MNEDVSCGLLPIPGYTWETLKQPDCWDEDFGNVAYYSEEYTFIVGWRTSAHAPYLIYNQPNQAIRARKLPGAAHLYIASVHVIDLCLATVGSNRVVATFNWRTGKLARRAAERCG